MPNAAQIIAVRVRGLMDELEKTKLISFLRLSVSADRSFIISKIAPAKFAAAVREVLDASLRGRLSLAALDKCNYCRRFDVTSLPLHRRDVRRRI
jgi:hypothetical protein